MIDNIKYWLWKFEMRSRMKKHPALPFIWAMRELTVYNPAFKKGGFDAVKQEHEQHIKQCRGVEK